MTFILLYIRFGCQLLVWLVYGEYLLYVVSVFIVDCFHSQSFSAILDSVHDDLHQSKVYLAGFMARAVAEVRR